MTELIKRYQLTHQRILYSLKEEDIICNANGARGYYVKSVTERQITHELTCMSILTMLN